MDSDDHTTRRNRILTDGGSWGSWTYVPAEMSLRFETGYTIDLKTIHDGAELLHWMGHMAEKEWLTDQELGQFVRAIDELFDIRNRPTRKRENARFNPVNALTPRASYAKDQH